MAGPLQLEDFFPVAAFSSEAVRRPSPAYLLRLNLRRAYRGADAQRACPYAEYFVQGTADITVTGNAAALDLNALKGALAARFSIPIDKMVVYVWVSAGCSHTALPPLLSRSSEMSNSC